MKIVFNYDTKADSSDSADSANRAGSVDNANCPDSVAFREKYEDVISNTITQTLISEGLEGIKPEVCVTLTDNAGIRELNKTYRQIDKETDCLSFPQYEKEQIDKMREQGGERGGNNMGDIGGERSANIIGYRGFERRANKRRLRRNAASTARLANKNIGCMLGDIVISFEKAQEQAKEYNHMLEREIAFLSAHSALHLLGYDHMNYDDEKQMREKQERILEKLGYVR
ncbi:MAG: rRNA maturation RNase YbeY [Clostridiales bacterium]|jgi:probable rRNA maturation factor|nr:rRNA maturation RNase YbeY [Clostridiales bacterium]